MRFKPISRLMVTVTVAILMIPVLFSATPGSAFDPTQAPVSMDRDGDGRVGEETAIKNRIRAYIDHHGRDGELTSRQMLDRARWSYNEWLQHRHDPTSKAGIEGDGWVNIGPVNGAGRASCVAPHPTYEGVILQGAASGGVWKTLDAGTTWYPTTDGLSDLSVGAVAWAPGSPDVVYLGTGEGDTLLAGGSGGIPGIGLLRSDDGGETWILPSGDDDPVARFFFALDIDPEDDESVFAATEQGLLHTADGGVTWETLLPAGSGINPAYSEILRSQSNPELMYAAQWCESTCPAGTERVMRSTDRGETWVAVGGEGLPGFRGYSNRAALAMAQSDPQVLYLATNLTTGTNGPILSGIFRTDDGGETWSETALSTTANANEYLGAQAWYDNTITVKPTDANVVVAGGIWYVRTSDGGTTWENLNPYASGGGMGTATLPHVDAHDLQWQGDTLWLGCDGGVWVSENDGIGWRGRNDGVVTRQYYGMDIDPINRERVLGGTQDNGTDLRNDEGDDTFEGVLGGDGFDCAINPMLPDLMYGTIYYTAIYRRSPSSGSFSDVSPYTNEEDAPFVTPLTMHPTKPNTLYTGATSLYVTDNGGDSWYRLPTDPITDVTNGVWSRGIVRAIAATPADPDRIAVSKGAAIYNSTDAGRTWVMGLVGRTAYNVAISPFDTDLVLAAMQASSLEGGGVLRSTDGGLNWSVSGSGLPPFNVQVVRFDPLDSMVAYAGTDVGLYRSIDGGLTWERYGEGLPAASVNDLRMLPDGSMLRVGSYGRGFWELSIPRPENTPPTIEITTPSGSSLSAQALETINLEAIASDSDGDELMVDWYFTNDFEILATDSGTGSVTSSPSPTVGGAGMYQVVARATDAHGEQAVDSVTMLAFEPADECGTPRVIPASGPFPTSILTSNQFARDDETDPLVPCIDPQTSDPNSGREASLWFEFTPSETATYAVSTCGSAADTVLSTWTGDACGSYTPVEGACNDDDEQVHCLGARTDSFLELGLDAGTTYRFMVGAWRSLDGTTYRGQVKFNIDCLDCTGMADDMMYMIAGAAHVAGIGETSWITDLTLYNPGDEDVTARIAFLPGGSDNSDAPEVEVTVLAGTTSNYSDVVLDLLGSRGAGAIRIVADGTLVGGSRTFNDSNDGTFGQFIPAATIDRAVAAGDNVKLIGLAGNAAFRTNIGFANASAETASVRIELFASDGNRIGQFGRTLEPWGWLQVSEVFSLVDAGDVEAATAVVHNLSTSSSIFVYASLVDEITGDPTLITETMPGSSDTDLWVAASAHATGYGTSLFATDLEFANSSLTPATVTIDMLRRNQDNSDPATAQVTVPAGESMKVADVIDTLFDYFGTAALRLSIDGSGLFATSRTFDMASDGTYGQFIPGVTSAAATEFGDTAAVIGIRTDDGFRTNIGLVNLTGDFVRVHIEFYDGSGTLLGTQQHELEPFTFIQNPAEYGTDLRGAFALLTTSSEDGSFLAYASIVDNGSNDPTYVPAKILID